MVSQLSARLLADYSTEKSLSDGSKSSFGVLHLGENENAGAKEKPSVSEGGTSGYTADLDAPTSPHPPCMIGTKTRKEPSGTHSTGRREKRQKLAEQNYAASTVKADLERDDREVPDLLRDGSHTSPMLGGLELSNVSHVFSKDFDARVDTGPERDYDEYYASVGSLGEACRSFYNLIPEENIVDNAEQGASSESASATSSVTNESEDRIFKCSTSSDREDDPSLIAMGDSISIGLLPLGSKGERSIGAEARLVVLSFEPFTIIHANTVYATMCGRPTKSILGKPLREIFLAKEFCAAIGRPEDHSEKDSALLELNGRVLRTKSTRNGNLQCQMNVSKLSTEYYAVAG